MAKEIANESPEENPEYIKALATLKKFGKVEYVLKGYKTIYKTTSPDTLKKDNEKYTIVQSS